MTAIMFTDRCLMRSRHGLRVEATTESNHPTGVWTILPAAVLNALCHTDNRQCPPALLIVRAFGNIHDQPRFHLHTTPTAPVPT